jgi:hypothetical protein
MNNDPPASEEKEDEDSIIHVFFDTLGVKKIVKRIFNFIHIKTTDQFIDGFILLIYLSLLFASLELINWNHLSVVVTLFMVGIFIFFELIGKNTDVLKRFLFSEESNKWFIENINSFSYDQIRYKIKNRVFSFSNITLLLTKITHHPDLNSSVIIEGILENNDLSKENIDKIFSPDLLGIFREGFVHYLLMRFKNSLTIGNIQNLYTFYKSNDLMIKMIFATQLHSELLITMEKEDPRLKKYFEIFQNHRSNELKKIDDKMYINVVRIRLTFFVVVLILCLISLFYMVSRTNPITSEMSSALVIMAFILTMIIVSPLVALVINPYLFSYREQARMQFIETVRNTN